MKSCALIFEGALKTKGPIGNLEKKIDILGQQIYFLFLKFWWAKQGSSWKSRK